MRSTSVCVVGCVAMLAAGASAQDTTSTITGVVRARETEVVLYGAIVQVVKTRIRVETDAQGGYALRGLAPGPYQLRVQALGYAPVDTTVVLPGAEPISLDFRLPPSAIELNPVVSIGYGTVRKKDLTGSASSVNGTEIETNPVERAEQALAGRVPGMQIQTTNRSEERRVGKGGRSRWSPYH